MEIWIGSSLFAFDGRVLEVFGFPGQDGYRFHVRNLELAIDEPDAKGRRLVTIRAATPGSGGCALNVDEEDWAQAEPFLDAVLAAMPDEDD